MIAKLLPLPEDIVPAAVLVTVCVHGIAERFLGALVMFITEFVCISMGEVIGKGDQDRLLFLNGCGRIVVGPEIIGIVTACTAAVPGTVQMAAGTIEG